MNSGFGLQPNTGGGGTSGGSFTFGVNKTSTLGFCPGGTNTTTPSFGLQTVGTQSNAMASGLSFGSPSVQKTPFGTPNTGLTFGAAGQTTPGAGLSFGTPSSTGLSFGAPAGQASGLAFGTPTTSQPGLTFGTPTTSVQTGLTFGAPAGSIPQAGLSFGTPATTAQGGLPTFGTAPSFGQSGMTFGAPASTAMQPGLSFAAPVAAVAPAGAFGSVAATTPAQPTLGGFGTAGLAFGTPTTSATLPTLGGFGTPASTSAGFGLGTFGTGTAAGGSTFALPSTSAATTGFQGLTATTASKPLGLFGSTPIATTSSGLGFSLSLPAPSTNQGFSLGGGGAAGIFGGNKTFPSTSGTGLLGSAPATSTTSTTTLGLGGVDPSQSKTGVPGSTPGRTDTKAVKENQVPNEIVQTVDSFKNFVKVQKNLSSDIARGSAKSLHKVQEDTELLKQMLSAITSGLQRNAALAVRLKADTAKCLQNAEMAQRTHDTPPGLQYDNTAPLQYFQDLVSSFEHEMHVFSHEIENTEKHMHSLTQPVPLTSEELALAMRRLHDSFVALAGRLQSVHNVVESQKEQYLNLRKYFLKDSSNVFEEEAKKTALNNLKPRTAVKVAAGPTPFSALGSQHGFGLLPSVNTTISKPPFSSGNPLGWSSGQTQQQQPQSQQTQFSTSNLSSSLLTGGGCMLNTVNPLVSPQPVENQGFQLQKPPLGNKRGKR